jgi:hypothetical protein
METYTYNLAANFFLLRNDTCCSIVVGNMTSLFELRNPSRHNVSAQRYA